MSQSSQLGKFGKFDKSESSFLNITVVSLSLKLFTKLMLTLGSVESMILISSEFTL
jgi:hypothetical protein